MTAGPAARRLSIGDLMLFVATSAVVLSSASRAPRGPGRVLFACMMWPVPLFVTSWYRCARRSWSRRIDAGLDLDSPEGEAWDATRAFAKLRGRRRFDEVVHILWNALGVFWTAVPCLVLSLAGWGRTALGLILFISMVIMSCCTLLMILLLSLLDRAALRILAVASYMAVGVGLALLFRS